MKHLLITLITALMAVPAWAQFEDSWGVQESSRSSFGGGFGQEKTSAIFFGPKAGVDMSSLTGGSDISDLADGMGIGFSAGVQLKARFGRASSNSYAGTGLIGLGLELKYKENVAKCKADDDLKLGYLEVPVFLQLYPFKGSDAGNTFYIEAGASFAALMSKSPESLQPEGSNIIYETGELKGGDVRGLVGLGYTIPNTGLDINARYYIGTSELAGNFPLKMNTVEVSLAWLFNIGKFGSAK